MEEYSYHQPVLLHDCITGLNIKEDGKYADVTFGGGGHSREIISHLGKNGKLFAFDQDADAAKNVWKDERLIFVPQNFRYLKNFLRLHGIRELDGILADLGVSSHQFDEAERGFSIRTDAGLDMRMNRSGKLTAETVINEYEEGKIRAILDTYGEIENAAKLAQAIVRAREENRIQTTRQLSEIAVKFVRKKEKEHQYLARVFQALRIEVNEEITALKDFLDQSMEILKPGGRLVVMSYHSLEDRLVKNKMKTGDTSGEIKKDFFGNIFRPFHLITKKPIEASEKEKAINSRSRSAKLRIAEKI